MGFNNNLIIQYGYVDNGSNVQTVSKIINLPISFKQNYSCIITTINGKGIPSSSNLTIAQFTFRLFGPWENWPSRYGSWICVGF